MENLNGIIHRQIDLNKSTNLFFTDFSQVEIDPAFLFTIKTFVRSQGQTINPQIHSDTINYTMKVFLRRILLINQFIQVSGKKIMELREIYHHTWNELVKNLNIEGTLKQLHYPALMHWLEDLYPPEFIKTLRILPQIGNVPCGNYSPDFQIDTLGLTMPLLQEPILDIGCGDTALLVLYLRSLHKEAYGVDRYLEIQETYLQQINWFHYPLEPFSWGTIISNMAFTNHLLYTYLNDHVQIENYLFKYKQILESLMSGGKFYYSPGLPFLEERLDPGEFMVERKSVYKNIYRSVVTRLSRH